MKRFLSWLVLLPCFAGFVLLMYLDQFLLGFFIGLLASMSAFLKFIAILIGGSTLLGLFFAPLRYGTFLTVTASQAIEPSESGARYIFFGGGLTLTFILAMISRGFSIACLFVAIYGVLVAFFGTVTAKGQQGL